MPRTNSLFPWFWENLKFGTALRGREYASAPYQAINFGAMIAIRKEMMNNDADILPGRGYLTNER